MVNKRDKNEKGITLISLVITIIILLILAEVSIAFLGKNGILAKAKWTAYVTEYEIIEEQEELYINNYLIEKMLETNKVAALNDTVINIEQSTIKMYPVSSKINIDDIQNSLKETIKQIEGLNYYDLENESLVNLYKVDLDKINIKAKKSYAINIVSGMLYSIEYEDYNGKLYHTPKLGLISKDGITIEEELKDIGTYSLIVNAGQTVSWDSIEIFYDKYVENSTSIKIYISDDDVNWSEIVFDKEAYSNGEEIYNIVNGENSQYLKTEVTISDVDGKHSEIDYTMVNFYKYKDIPVTVETEVNGVELINGVYTVPTTTDGETEATGTGTITQKVVVPNNAGEYILDLGESYGNSTTVVKITNTDGTIETYTVTDTIELKKISVNPGSTVEVTTTLSAGDGVSQLKLLQKESTLSSQEVSSGVKSNEGLQNWSTVEKKTYVYNNGGSGYWQKCFVNDIEVTDSSGIILIDDTHRIKVSYQVTSGSEYGNVFTNIKNADNTQYLKVMVEYQVIEGNQYESNYIKNVTISLNDGRWKATFLDEDGTELFDDYVYYENKNRVASLTLPGPGIEKEINIFSHWLGNDGVTYEKNSICQMTDDMVFEAVWQLPTYTITYDANGGTGAPEKVVKTYGEDIRISDVVPIRNGYEFLGWSINSNASEADYQAGDNFTDNENTTLFAVWNQLVTLNYYMNNGTASVFKTEYYHLGETINLTTAVPSWTGHNCLGWSTVSTDSEAQFEPGATLTLDSYNINLYSIWESVPFYVFNEGLVDGYNWARLALGSGNTSTITNNSIYFKGTCLTWVGAEWELSNLDLTNYTQIHMELSTGTRFSPSTIDPGHYHGVWITAGAYGNSPIISTQSNNLTRKQIDGNLGIYSTSGVKLYLIFDRWDPGCYVHKIWFD